MIKSPPVSFYLKSLILKPASILIMLATGVTAFRFSGDFYLLLSRLLPISWGYLQTWLLISAIGGVGLISYWLKTLSNSEFKEKVQKEWSLKSLAQLQKTLREASKDYEKLRARPNYQRNRFDRIRKLEKDMFNDFSRLEDMQDPLTVEVMEQSINAFLRYYELLKRDQRLASLLESSNLKAINEEAERLVRQAEGAVSFEAKQQYLRAAEFKQLELKSLERVRQSSILLQAHLDTLESALSSLRARLINTTAWGQESLRFELSQLTQELMALEKSMEELEELETEDIIQIKETNMQ